MKRSMPKARKFDAPQGLQWDVSPSALERWTPNLAASAPSEQSISILDPIGFDPWTGEGVTAKRISAALRSIGAENDVVVNINSPGGDLFEGLAIYNTLREHKGHVTVKVLALAASAASIIAMAGDTVQVARSGFLMIHNTWVVAMGNRNDLRDIADTLEPFDRAMADIYAHRSGLDVADVQKMMDSETWIGGSDAVDQGLADSLLPSDEVKKDKNARGDRIAAYLLERALARAGMPRSERRELMHDFKAGGTRDAVDGAGTREAPEGTRNAARQPAAHESEVLSHLRSFTVPDLSKEMQ